MNTFRRPTLRLRIAISLAGVCSRKNRLLMTMHSTPLLTNATLGWSGASISTKPCVKVTIPLSLALSEMGSKLK